ncbi:MAG: NAD(P)-dependent oxidoreductase [Planctomycetes bacterium]|nr:NAD(P)-dependent oxidoreductase [Planctomycetota bacterium]
MPSILITGLNGTVAPALRAALEAAGRPCAGWDRRAASPDDLAAVRAHLDALDPAAVCHLALGPEGWAAELAAWCAERGRPFLFTSTAMVFHHAPGGPHRPGDARDARDDYGRYKARCEDAVRAAHPGAIVARLGWQLATRRGGNTMLEALHARAAADGVIRASTRWVPATSFLDDTAAALFALLDAGAGGTFHVDGNADAAWDFHRIVRALQARHGDPSWRVEPCDEPAFDQRLLDDRSRVAPITTRL